MPLPIPAEVHRRLAGKGKADNAAALAPHSRRGGYLRAKRFPERSEGDRRPRRGDDGRSLSGEAGRSSFPPCWCRRRQGCRLLRG